MESPSIIGGRNDAEVITALQKRQGRMRPAPSRFESRVIATSEGIIWHLILDYLSLDEIYLALRCVSGIMRSATEKYVFQHLDAWHGSFFQNRTRRGSNGKGERRRKQNINSILDHLLIRSSSNLLCLDLSSLHSFTGRSETKRGVSLLAVVFRRCPNLSTLNCSDCHRLEASALSEALDPSVDLSKLKRLYLSNCYRVNGWAVHHLLVHPSLQLKTLHLGGCSSNIGRHLSSNAQDRHLLFTGDFESLDLSGLKHLKGNLSDLIGLTQLRELVVEGCDRLLFTHRASEILYNRIIESSLLQTVHTDDEIKDGLSQIIDEAVENSLLAGSEFAHLRVLNWNDPQPRLAWSTALCLVALQSRQLVEVHLRGCESVRNEDIQILSISCGKTLKVCDFQGLSLLEDSGLQTVGRYCEVLVDLDVSVCFRISDTGIIGITHRCRRIRCLRMNHLKVTDGSLKVIARELSDLRVLSIQGCHGISEHVELPKSLIEIDTRETELPINKLSLPSSLVFKNGRYHYTTDESRNASPSLRQCSFARQSKRFQYNQTPEPMWSCHDCEMLPTRAICGACILHCHRGHRVEMVGLQRFYCDCAVGLGKEPCQCL